MQLIYPTKDEIMRFFEKVNGFISVIRISELLVIPHVQRSTPMDEEWRHIQGFLHQLKSEGFLIVQNEGEDIYHEKFSSTQDRIQKYFARNQVVDNSDLTKKTDSELYEIMRSSIDNSYVPSSIYNKAKLELEIRHNQNKQSDKPVRGKTVKKVLYKDENLFIKSRSQGDDQHLLIGKRDVKEDKAHIIVDNENGSLRLEDGRLEPTDIVPHIEVIATFPNGKRVSSTRSVIENNLSLPEIEVEKSKIGFSKAVTLANGLAESFTIMVPVIIRNLSNDKIQVRNIRTILELSEGYQWHEFYNDINPPNGRNINGRDFLPCTFGFAVNIKGRELGVNNENPLFVANRDKILSELSSKKIIFKFVAEIVSLDGTNPIEEVSDLTSILIDKIKITTN